MSIPAGENSRGKGPEAAGLMCVRSGGQAILAVAGGGVKERGQRTDVESDHAGP